MKKRVLTIAATVVAMISCMFGMIACSDNNADIDGVYDFYELCEDGSDVWHAEKDPFPYILKDGVAVVNDGEVDFVVGTYTVENGKLVYSFGANGNGDKYVMEKRGDAWFWKEDDGSDGFLLIPEGKIPQGYVIENGGADIDGVYDLYEIWIDDNEWHAMKNTEPFVFNDGEVFDGRDPDRLFGIYEIINSKVVLTMYDDEGGSVDFELEKDSGAWVHIYEDADDYGFLYIAEGDVPQGYIIVER